MSGLRHTLVCLLIAAAPALAIATMPAIAGADVVHVVTKGQTIDQVAKKYGVTVKAIAAANKLKDPTSLKPGTKLTIPQGKAALAAAAKTYELKPKHPGRVTFVRFGSKETQQLQVVTKKSKLVPGILPRVARIMRFGPLNIEHAIDPRLVTLVAQVSDHFGGRNIEIISGFRPKTPTQYTPHSNHNIGKAIDMRIAGVPNEVLRDYCRTFKNTGVGYYPNSLFVHFDVRAKSTFWVDLSKPGEKPNYVGSNPDIDHGVDDATAEGGDLKNQDPPADSLPQLPAPGGSAPPALPAPPPPAPPVASGGQK